MSQSPFGMGSVGFVYYNTSNTSNDSSDYIQFNNSQEEFNPETSSSPVRQNNRRWQKPSKKYTRYHNQDFNNTVNRPHTNRTNSQQNTYRQRGNRAKTDNDINNYYHPSMLLDPWKHLRNYETNQITKTTDSNDTFNNSKSLEDNKN